ncbi:ABC transporter substrate-binding protein [Paraburkholderia sp. MM6662-R1]|uniref:ABC transporter substrate-binding protein n=1 Tax=Paraburkholderia sp. MM6662-R1 TaxID=2991066 RepID=UPI003D23A588
MSISRRNFIKTTATAAALIGTPFAEINQAFAASTITAIEWGGAYIDSIKRIAAKQSDVSINWQLHAGGAAAILPKIKATWPKPGIDLLTGWDVSWQVVAREGWAEPVTAAKVPNLADIPKKLLVADAAGHIVNIPRTLTAFHWFYREDNAPFAIRTLDDLLDPRLAGKILFPSPILNSNTQMISIALHRGGNEKNMEPAWDFVKKLAKSGNIGRVANADTDVTTSIGSGETCVAFQAGSLASKLGRTVKLKNLIKLDPKTGFRAFIYQEGWCVLKGGNADGAFKFANFAIDPVNNAEFNKGIDGIPVNTKSVVPAELKYMVFNSEEMDKYAYIPDWSYVSSQSDAWLKRWEQEIAPLL